VTHQEAPFGPPVAAPRRDRDQVVVLRDIPWAQYDALCDARAESAGPRLAYLEGTLEIMSPSRRHEYEKTLIARLVEAYAEESGLSLNGYGSETYRRKAEEAGIEPDECYCVGPAKKVPDFAIEVFYTSGGVNKLEIYRRLKVPEVWFWAKGGFWIYRLRNRRYAQVERSEVLPDLDLDAIARLVAETDESHQTEAVRAFRRTLRRRR
jgi:Uma2 family endonuclease